MLLPPFHLCAAPASAATVDPTAEYRNMPIIRNYLPSFYTIFLLAAIPFLQEPSPSRELHTRRSAGRSAGAASHPAVLRISPAGEPSAPHRRRNGVVYEMARRYGCTVFRPKNRGGTVPVAILIKSLCSTGLSHNKRNLSGSIFCLLLIYESGSTKGLKNQGDFRGLSQKSVL